MATEETGRDASKDLIQENRRLRRAVEELSVLNELAREIGSSHDLDQILSKITRRAIRAVLAAQGVITLVSDEASDPMKTLVRTIDSSEKSQPLRLQQNLQGWMHLNKQPLLLNDPSRDPRFAGVHWDDSVQSVLSVPLFARSRMIGVLTVYNKQDSLGFTDDDQRLLSILASQSAQVIENARLYEEEKALLTMQKELRLAYEIQVNLLPKQPPQIEGYDVAGISIPAQMVGGDYFDYLALDDHLTGFCVADVSGKGLPAALLMASVQATLRAQAFSRPSVKECIQGCNTQLSHSIRKGSFVTMCYGVLDARGHGFTFGNAGHNRPLLRSADGSVSRLHTAGIPMGFKAGFSYQEESLTLSPGDVIFLYSDGITEAMNAAREEYGEERLASLLSLYGGEPAAELLARVLREVGLHRGDALQQDDMTILVLRRRR